MELRTKKKIVAAMNSENRTETGREDISIPRFARNEMNNISAAEDNTREAIPRRVGGHAQRM